MHHRHVGLDAEHGGIEGDGTRVLALGGASVDGEALHDAHDA
jgi:hypothetical protein